MGREAKLISYKMRDRISVLDMYPPSSQIPYHPHLHDPIGAHIGLAPVSPVRPTCLEIGTSHRGEGGNVEGERCARP